MTRWLPCRWCRPQTGLHPRPQLRLHSWPLLQGGAGRLSATSWFSLLKEKKKVNKLIEKIPITKTQRHGVNSFKVWNLKKCIWCHVRHLISCFQNTTNHSVLYAKVYGNSNKNIFSHLQCFCPNTTEGLNRNVSSSSPPVLVSFRRKQVLLMLFLKRQWNNWGGTMYPVERDYLASSVIDPPAWIWFHCMKC